MRIQFNRFAKHKSVCAAKDLPIPLEVEDVTQLPESAANPKRAGGGVVFNYYYFHLFGSASSGVPHYRRELDWNGQPRPQTSEDIPSLR